MYVSKDKECIETSHILWRLYGDFERYFNDDLEFRLSMHAVINIEHFFTYWSLSKMIRTSQPVKVHLLLNTTFDVNNLYANVQIQLILVALQFYLLSGK